MADGDSYTVKQGDTLASIAEEQLSDASRWPEIFVLNRDIISDPDEIVPGQVLTLPRGPAGSTPVLYTVRRGDTLSAIAERELGDADRWPEIFGLNREMIEDPDEILPGQVLVLPHVVQSSDARVIGVVWSRELPAQARVGLAQQTEDALTGAAVDARGVLVVTWVHDDRSWHWPAPIGPAILEPGAGVALAQQSTASMTAATVGRDGRLHIAWADSGGPWQGPVPVGKSVLDPSSNIALAHQVEETYAALALARDGTLHVAWTDGETWQGPVPVGGPVLSPGSGIALGRQGEDTTTAVAIGKDHRLHVAWANDVGDWQAPVPVGEPVLSLDSGVALVRQGEDTVTAVAIGDDRRLHVAWTEGGAWQPPIAVGDPVLSPGSGVAIAHQTDDTYVAVAIGDEGTLHVAWTEAGGPWQGPVPVGRPDLEPTSGIALARQDNNTLTCLATGKIGVLYVASVEDTKSWQGPWPTHGACPRLGQLTGDSDPEGLPHVNDSFQFGVGGTDLGFAVEHDGSLVLLFGDQFGAPDDVNADPIGVSTATEAGPGGFTLGYVTPGPGRFRPFTVKPFKSLLALDTPTGGFSHVAQASTVPRLWAFLNKDKDGNLLGSTDNLEREFDLHFTVAGRGHHQLLHLAGARVVKSREWPELTSAAEDCLLICGQAFPPDGTRAHLAWIDLPLETPSVSNALDAPQLLVNYFAGFRSDGRPRWTLDPVHASEYPLFDLRRAVTFVSLSWLPELRRWIALYTEGRSRWTLEGPITWDPVLDPGEAPWKRPIVLRSSPTPWGPWSEPVALVAPAEAYGRWLHDPEREDDPRGAGGLGGWLYCPVVVDRFTRWHPETQTASIHFLLSAGAPYHVQLMRADLRLYP